MKPIVFSFSLLTLVPMLAWSESAQVLVWPQSEGFYASKGVTASRRTVENAPSQPMLMPSMPASQAYPAPAPMGYAPVAAAMPYTPFAPAPSNMMPAMPQAFPNSPSGFLPPMPQGLPSSLPNFSAPTMTFPSVPNMMPSYGAMPFSPMPGFGNMPFNSGGFPSNGFGNMMPFLGGNSFSGMPFGFGY